jgi:hypothetical protein
MRWSSKDVQLQWEGAAGRQPDGKLLVEVEDLKAAGKGTLAQLRNHPSLAQSMPDPVDLRASVLRHTGVWSGSGVSLRYPQYLLPDATTHDRLALAVIGEKVCVCLARVPSAVPESALEAWLAQWKCD